MFILEANIFIDQKVRLHFASAGLDRTAINTIYSHVLNPMIASRSYMSIEPIELWLDPRALRRGLVYPVDPDSDPSALLIQDSGMVPISTQIAIVNPETCRLCHIGEYGEIWVQSEACAKAFYGSKQEFDMERFNGRTIDGDPNSIYVRTGDLGFLHNVTRPIGAGGQPVEMQVLFVLGSVGETFEVNGLNHFPVDIEASVEKCHRNITPGGSAVFQAGGLVVVLVEVFRKAYLASIVPVIVNAILNEHQLVIDIVAFVANGDFPRSRLGEKQRGKILAGWVTRKMRSIAQFGIRDSEGNDSQLTDIPEARRSTLMSKSTTQSFSQGRASMSNPPTGDANFNEGLVTSPETAEFPRDPQVVRADTSESMGTPTMALNDQPYELNAGYPDEGGYRNTDRPSDYQTHQLSDAPYTLDNDSPPLQADELIQHNEEPQVSETVFPKRTTSMRVPSNPPRLSVMNPETFESVPERPEDDTPTATTTTSTTAPSLPRFQRTDSDLEPNFSGPEIMSPYDDSANPFIDAEMRDLTENIDRMLQAEAVPEPLNPRRSDPEPQRARTPPSRMEPSPPSSARPTSTYVGGRGTLPSQQARYSSYGTGSTEQSPARGGSNGGGLRVMNAGSDSDEDEPPSASLGKPPPHLPQQGPPMLSASATIPHHTQQSGQPPPPPPKEPLRSNNGEHDGSEEEEEPWPEEALLYTQDPAVRARILRERMGSTRKNAKKSNYDASGGYGDRLTANGTDYGNDDDGGRPRGSSIAQSDVSSVAGSVRRRYDGSDW